MKISGSELVGRFLESRGVEYVFGISGHGIIPISAEIMHRKNPKWILTQSEMLATAAASGYFKATHKPGVVLTSVGPGLIAAIPTLVSAAIDNSALVVISGDVPMKYWDKGISEEIDIKAGGDQRTLLREITKRTYLVTDVSRITDTLNSAFREAIHGKPGPVLVSIPFDIQSEVINIDEKDITKQISSDNITNLCCPQSSISKTCDLLLEAKKLVIIAGGGVRLSGAENEITELANLLGVPVVCTFAGQGSIDVTDPYYVGQAGRDGIPLAMDITRSADLILAVGTRFEEYESCFWVDGVALNIPPTKLIQIDVTSRELGKNYPVEIGIIGDAKTVLAQIIDFLHERKGRINNNGTIIKQHIKSEKEKYLDSLKKDIQSNKKPVRFRRLIQELINVFPDDGILEVEAGTARGFALQQYIPVKRRNYFVECGFQFIGYGPASALGIKFGRPEQPVISLTGDGAFMLTVQSIITSVIYNIPIVWIVLNNYGYNCVRGLALEYFDGASIGAEWKKGEALWSPDYVKLAESFGANGIRVEDPQEIGPALKNAIKSQKTWVIDIPVERELRFSELVSAKSAWDYYFPKWERK